MLGDDTGGGTAILPPIRFQFAGVWISAGLPFTHTHMQLTISVITSICLIFNFPGLPIRNYGVGGGVSVYMFICYNTGGTYTKFFMFFAPCIVI